MHNQLRARMRMFDGAAVALTLLIICVGLSVGKSEFLTGGNVSNILEQVSMNGIIAMGMTMLLVSANFDLSVGGIVGVSGVVATDAANAWGLVPGIIIALALATALGVVNGLIVTRLKVNSLVATLGTGLIYLGAAYAISHNTPVILNSGRLGTIVGSNILGVNMSVYVLAAVVVVSAWFLHTTVGGRQLYAVGANPEAARYAGVRVELLRFIPFCVTGLYCGISAVILMGFLNSGVPDAADSWALEIVAAVVVGGVSIAGGQGTILMAVLGILLIGVINNGLNLLNLAAGWQDVTTGAVLVLAVAIDVVLGARARRAAIARATQLVPASGETSDDSSARPPIVDEGVAAR